jgi:transcriptional regulator with XRE-family HTH domain
MAQNKTMAAEELGLALVALRKRSGLTVRQLAGRLGSVSPGNISNWSNGRLVPLDRLIQILDEFDVRGDERERLLGLRRQAEGPGQLTMGTTGVNPKLLQLIDHEAAAQCIKTFELGLVPGLLQTREYATAILGELQDADIRLDLRMGRKKILTRDQDPVELVALIDSSVLQRPVAPKEAMVGQLRHLLAMAERPNVEIRVVPTTTPGCHPGLLGPFIVIEFPQAQPIVHIEHHRVVMFLWDSEVVAWYTAAAEELTERALNPDDTFETIEAHLKEMERT